jgi:hypothetical protein
MKDLSKNALTEQDILILVPLGVPFYTDKDTGKTYIRKQYWNGITPKLREAISNALTLGDHNNDNA